MKLSQVKDVLSAEVYNGKELLDTDVSAACGSDLMSDVMAFVKDHVLLLTGLISPQVIRTAEMMDIRAIVFVRGKTPNESMIEMAEEKGVVLLSTKDPMYIACGKLYGAGLTGKGVRDID